MSQFNQRLQQARERAATKQYGSPEAYHTAQRKDTQAHEFILAIGRVLTVLIYIGLFVLASGAIYYLWNCTAPLLGLQVMPFEAACGLVLMVLVLRFILR